MTHQNLRLRKCCFQQLHLTSLYHLMLQSWYQKTAHWVHWWTGCCHDCSIKWPLKRLRVIITTHPFLFQLLSEPESKTLECHWLNNRALSRGLDFRTSVWTYVALFKAHYSTLFQAVRFYYHVFCRPWSVRTGKNCALGLEYGFRPYSRPWAQFFPILISQPANNIYVSRLPVNDSIGSTPCDPLPPERELATECPLHLSTLQVPLYIIHVQRGDGFARRP